jgi:hypothetical protein
LRDNPVMKRGKSIRWMTRALLAGACLGWGAGQAAGVVYRCPGNPVLYTDTLSAKEAKEKGCKTLEGTPITVVQGQRPAKSASGAATSGQNRVDPNDQRARDSDARRILEAELKKEEDALAEMQKAYNNGEPERQGDEKNYQKYIDRVAEMKASLMRKESDIAALKREIAKLQ